VAIEEALDLAQQSSQEQENHQQVRLGVGRPNPVLGQVAIPGVI
jgi:hypothetical protein